MQAGRHSSEARSTGKSDITHTQIKTGPASQIPWQEAAVGLWHTRPKRNAANQESTAAQCRLIVLTELIGSRAGGCTARL